MTKQYDINSPEYRTIIKLELAAYHAAMAQEMAAYRPACLRDRDEQ